MQKLSFALRQEILEHIGSHIRHNTCSHADHYNVTFRQ